MKDKIIAVAILLTVLLATGLNAWFLMHEIDKTIEEAKTIDISKNGSNYEAEKIFQRYLEREHYISLTVSHDDLTRIEENFCEVIACLKVGDNQAAEIAKDRLIRSLEHLRRLSGFNIDSII